MSSLILGIETSCDETAAAVVEAGRRIISSVTHSQVEVHHPYGGIVPELAGREHIRNIVPAVTAALDEAGVSPSELAAVGVASTPGLLGALLVGVSFGKALSWSLSLPLVMVNHLEGHILSIFLAGMRPRFPFTALVVSGGHTSLYLVSGYTRFEILGRTRDDAAGEAFDKVAKYLGLGYPGGPVLESLAREGDPGAISFPRPLISGKGLDFSFSGLKTAVVNYLRDVHGYRHQGLGPREPYLPRETLADIAASFQEAVVDVLVRKALLAAGGNGSRHLVVSGGVAANSRLRRAFEEAGTGLKVLFPPVSLCTDNAAMIAGAAWHRLREGLTADLSADASARDIPG
jgi:N6-L-threonylcarbamoyladenine synthase